MSTGTTAQSLVTQLAELMKKSESELKRLGSEISKKDKQISDLENRLETAKAERADLAAQADLLKSAIHASGLPGAAVDTQQAVPAAVEENAAEASAAVEPAAGPETVGQAAGVDDDVPAVGEDAGSTDDDGQVQEDGTEAAAAPAPEAKTGGKATRRKPRKTASTVKAEPAEPENAEPAEAVEADAEPAPVEEQPEVAAVAAPTVEREQDAEPAGGQQSYPDPWDDVDSGDAAADDGEETAKMVFSPVSFADDDEDDDDCL